MGEKKRQTITQKKKANNKLQVAIFEFLVWKFLKFLNITIGYKIRK